jgi:hypothetical protein
MKIAEIIPNESIDNENANIVKLLEIVAIHNIMMPKTKYNIVFIETKILFEGIEFL